MILAIGLTLNSGCSRRPDNQEPSRVHDIVHTIEDHGISVTLTFAPGIVDPREDALLTIQTRFPAGLPIDFPDAEAAIEGFSLAARLSPPDTRDPAGYQIRETVLRITPIPGSTYRIAPMLFAIHPTQGTADETQYLITPAIRPPVRRLETIAAPSLTQQPQPVYIPPTPAEIARWIAVSIAILAIIIAVVILAKHLKRKIAVIRMSPLERARYELQHLLEKDLPAKGEFKEFYFAITGIIRTYIERQHGIRAPELTTPEFLTAAAKRPEFPPAVVDRLQEFLESADLVKFAAWTPTKRAINDAIETARRYLDEDQYNKPEEEA